MADETIFDKILSGEIPASKVYENDSVLAFKDIAPQSPVHVLVIPKKKLQCFADLKKADVDFIGHFFQEVSKVAEKLDLEEDGYRIVINNGKYGHQTVDYLHAHILGGRQLSPRLG